jgi:drug/metabolite transporter (DMT)-like permease
VAVALGLLIGRLRGQLGGWIVQLKAAGTLRLMIPAAITGTFLGVWFSMLAFQYTSIAEATTLTATSPIFVIPLVILVLRQRVAWTGILGAVLAVIGVAILCWR